MPQDSYTIIYDGRCNFCRCTKSVLEMFDWWGNLRFIDFHDDAAMRQFPQISQEMASKEVIAVAPDGRQAGGYDAIVMMTEAWPLTGLLRWILRFSIIHWIGVKLYELVSKNRQRIKFLPTCSISGAPAVAVA